MNLVGYYKNAEDSRMTNLPDYIASQDLTVVAECELE